MPENNPQVGETWEIINPSTSTPEQAVIGSFTPTAVRLISRLGRVISFPHRSFELSWKFAHGLQDHDCKACPNPGYLQIEEAGVWVWVCEEHLPPEQNRIRLPGDNPRNLESLPGGISQCPNCQLAIRDDRPFDAGSFTCHRCLGCNHIWTLLLGRGIPEDGLNLSEMIIDVADALHGRVMSLEALVGSAALSAIQRAVGDRSWRSGAHIGGVHVTSASRFGSLSVVIVGPSGTANVSRLGGIPDRGHVHNEKDADEQLAKMDGQPKPGDTWFHSTAGTPAYVHNLDATPEGDPFVIFREDPSEPASNLLLKDFLSEYTFQEVPPPCQVGDELVKSTDDSLWIVTEMTPDAHQAVVRSKGGRRIPLTFHEVRLHYRTLVRKSAYEHLLGGGGTFDFDPED